MGRLLTGAGKLSMQLFFFFLNVFLLIAHASSNVKAARKNLHLKIYRWENMANPFIVFC